MFSSILPLAILILGFRHGFDWDHIAAISDIVLSTKNRKQAILYGFIYSVGHAVVVIFLGLLAIVLGVSLPEWADNLMGPLVGLTLIILGFWIILSIIIKKREFKFISRWMLLFQGIANVYNHLLGKHHEHQHIKYPQSFGIKTSYLIGTIHGIGAETPTQILLFVTAAGVGGGIYGSFLLLIFVIGLLISNSLVVILSFLGLAKVRKNFKIYGSLGILVGAISIIIGALFFLGVPI